MAQDRVFIYNAQASALGGFLSKPYPEVIDAQATASLPASGGYASASVGEFRFRELISFRSAHTQVSGGEKNGKFTTRITSTIEGLDILGVISADAVTLTLASEYDPDDPDEEPRITPIGSEFVGLRVGGQPLAIETHVDTFTEYDTFAKLQRAYESKPDLRDMLRRDFLWDADAARDTSPRARGLLEWAWKDEYREKLPIRQGRVSASLIRTLRSEQRAVSTSANMIEIPQTGVVHLAELKLKPGERRLTMFRIELGSSFEGRVAALDAGTNGHDFP